MFRIDGDGLQIGLQRLGMLAFLLKVMTENAVRIGVVTVFFRCQPQLVEGFLGLSFGVEDGGEVDPAVGVLVVFENHPVLFRRFLVFFLILIGDSKIVAREMIIGIARQLQLVITDGFRCFSGVVCLDPAIEVAFRWRGNLDTARQSRQQGEPREGSGQAH